MDSPTKIFTLGAKWWFAIISLLILAWYSAIIGKLHSIQMKREPVPLGIKTTKTMVLNATRGDIRDRNGNSLAMSYAGWELFVDGANIASNQAGAVFTELARLNAFDVERIHSAVTTEGRYNVFGYTADREIIDSIVKNPVFKSWENGERNIGLKTVPVRKYPLATQCCHIIGLADYSDNGPIGAEKQFNERLTGVNGSVTYKVDAHSEPILEKSVERTEAVNGENVYLTIDRKVQDAVETELDKYMELTDAERGVVIVQNPKTGEILAMASRPNYDLGRYGASPRANKRNIAVSDQYEPGSIFKTLTFAAVVDAGLMTTGTLINVANVPFAGKTISDHKGMPDWITLTDAMRFSSNRAAARAAIALGSKKYEEYLRAFGIGQNTGSGIHNEISGFDKWFWTEMELTRRSFGQGITVTALQMTAAFSAIANGGVLLRPTILSHIKNQANETVYKHTPEAGVRVVSEEAARDTTFMLRTVLESSGTGHRGRIPGYDVAGKTGTAQIAGVGGYNNEDYVASFTGFFPASDPQVVILVSLVKPRDKVVDGKLMTYHLGGSSAAPLFSDIGRKLAGIMQIPQDYPTDL